MFCAPGNPGFANENKVSTISIEVDDINELVKFANDKVDPEKFAPDKSDSERFAPVKSIKDRSAFCKEHL